MAYILEISTYRDILDTQVNPGFPLPFQRFHGGKITPGDLNIPQGAVIIVIAHGNDDEIGNANDNIVALNAETFIATITANMANNAQPARIYISACGQRGLATFAAKIALIAQNEQIWLGTEIYGHIDSIHGNVPGPNDNRWTAIYVGRRALNTLTSLTLEDEMLTSKQDAILALNDEKIFPDSDGLISFVNLASSFVTDNKEYKTGRAVCDKVSNFFATLRSNVFLAMTTKDKNKRIEPLPGDLLPTTQWHPAVTHYMQYLLTQAGGLTNYKVTTETYSFTQVITEFSTDLIKLMFDAVNCPPGIVNDVVKFVQGVGTSLRASWDDKSRQYQTALLGQCHEAVPTDATGNTTVYFPKIKYYYISVDSSQQAFTLPCAKLEEITFNFQYEYYVTGLKASILEEISSDYKKFVNFIDKAENKSYKDATNNLEQILEDTTSTTDAANLMSFNKDGLSIYGVDLLSYPKTAKQPPKPIETILNGLYQE